MPRTSQRGRGGEGNGAGVLGRVDLQDELRAPLVVGPDFVGATEARRFSDTVFVVYANDELSHAFALTAVE